MTRQQPAEVRRGRILEAAASLLVKDGLRGTSMDAVATAAGIAKGTVYIYFPSRSDLLAALRHRYAEDLARRAETVLDAAERGRAGSWAAAFEKLVAELTDYLLANRRLHHVLFQEAGVAEEETMGPLRHLIRERLKRAMDSGAIDAMDPDILMRFVLDGLHGAVVPLFHQRRPDRERVVAGLSEVIRRVLAPGADRG